MSPANWQDASATSKADPAEVGARQSARSSEADPAGVGAKPRVDSTEAEAEGVDAKLHVRSSEHRRAEAAPRLGFLGTGWIGRHRMEAIHRSGFGHVAMICDPAPEMASAAVESVPGAKVVGPFEEMLSAGLDGIVIATPSALHAEQAIAALESGAAVFCQKPLGRTADEVARVVETARKADLLLEVDLSYRFTTGMQRIRELVSAEAIGRVYAADLVFHNAYGPDKDWFYDAHLSGGGCVMDLGIHLVDLALWTLGFPAVEEVRARLYQRGELLAPDPPVVEDYGIANLLLQRGVSVRIATSWRLHTGCDAHIEASFHGAEGGLRLRNVGGSFYNFVAERFTGTSAETLTSPPDEWGGRAATAWAQRLAAGERFDPAAERLIEVAGIIDRIYGR
ncbi:MAG TPA: Gfo/Idh/MocA family oxidoreductase [Longimicrobiaceae bacterium]